MKADTGQDTGQQAAARITPVLTELNRHFWTGGAEGVLRFFRCADCGLYLHPPAPVCRRCLSDTIGVAAVSGRGHVLTYTVNHQSWRPGVAVPYNIALVELVEQPALRLTTNLVGIAGTDIEIGMPVQVEFEQVGEIFIPVFAPAEPASTRGRT
jgi:uncharacterized OB-fold protein